MLNISEAIHGIRVSVKIVMFALVTTGCKVIENADTHLGQAHVVPKLLALLIAELPYRLTLDIHLAFGEEVYEMTMLDGMSVEVNGEVILPLVWNIPFL